MKMLFGFLLVCCIGAWWAMVAVDDGEPNKLNGILRRYDRTIAFLTILSFAGWLLAAMAIWGGGK